MKFDRISSIVDVFIMGNGIDSSKKMLSEKARLYKRLLILLAEVTILCRLESA